MLVIYDYLQVISLLIHRKLEETENRKQYNRAMLSD